MHCIFIVTFFSNIWQIKRTSCLLLVACLAYSSITRMEAEFYSEISVNYCNSNTQIPSAHTQNHRKNCALAYPNCYISPQQARRQDSGLSASKHYQN
jgi:hypothetical protein